MDNEGANDQNEFVGEGLVKSPTHKTNTEPDLSAQSD